MKKIKKIISSILLLFALKAASQTDSCLIASCTHFQNTDYQQMYRVEEGILEALSFTASGDTCYAPVCFAFQNTDLYQLYTKLSQIKQAIVSGGFNDSAYVPLMGTLTGKPLTGSIQAKLKVNQGAFYSKDTSLILGWFNNPTQAFDPSKTYSVLQFDSSQYYMQYWNPHTQLSEENYFHNGYFAQKISDYRQGKYNWYEQDTTSWQFTNTFNNNHGIVVSGVSHGDYYSNSCVDKSYADSLKALVTYTAGTGISIFGGTITNTAPNQTVSLTGAGTTTITGTYPTFTINSSASSTSLTANRIAYGSSTNTVTSSSNFQTSVGTNTVVMSVSSGVTGSNINLNPTSGDPPHIFEVVNDNASQFTVRYSTYGSGTLVGQNDFHYNRYRGTSAHPASIKSGDYFWSNGFRGAYGTGLDSTFGGVSQSQAAFQCLSTENWVDNSHLGTAFNWLVTPKGSGTRQQGMYLSGESVLFIGSNNNLTPLNSGHQSIDIQENTNSNAGSIMSRNNAAGTSAKVELLMQNNNNNYFDFSCTSTTWSNGGSTAFSSDAVHLYSKATNSMRLISNNAIQLYSGGINSSNGAANFSTSQNMYVGSGTATATAKLQIAASTTANASERITSGTAPTSPNDGDIWNDATQKTLIANEAGVNQSLVGAIYTQTAAVTVANTTVSTTALTNTVSIPANFFTVGKTLRLKLMGFYSAVTSPNITIIVKLGSTTILTTGAVASGNSTNAYCELNALLTCQSTGVSGTVYAQGLYNEEGGGGGSNIFPMVNTSATTINTTASQNLDVQIQWGTASASDTQTWTNAIIDVVK